MLWHLKQKGGDEVPCAFEHVNGTDWWSYLKADPKLEEEFAKAMKAADCMGDFHCCDLACSHCDSTSFLVKRHARPIDTSVVIVGLDVLQGYLTYRFCFFLYVIPCQTHQEEFPNSPKHNAKL